MPLMLRGMGATSRRGVVRGIEQPNRRWLIHSNEITSSGETQVFNPIEALDRAAAETIMANNARELATELDGGDVQIVAVPLSGSATATSTRTGKKRTVTRMSATKSGAALVEEKSSFPWGWVLLGVGVIGAGWTYWRMRGGRARLPFLRG